MSTRLITTLSNFLTHRLLQLLWLCWALIAPWVCLAIDAYLWALVSLFSLYASVPLMLVCAAQLFRVRNEPLQRRNALLTLLVASGATGHLLLHLVWITQLDWSF